MRAETETLVDEIRQALSLLRRHLDWDAAQKRLGYLNSRAEDPSLWDDPAEAQKLMRERQTLEENIASINRIQQTLDDSIELIELGEMEGDDTIVREAENAISDLQGEIEKRRIETLLSGEMDQSDAFLEVHAGAGGTESQDWANMLLRMYTRWAEKRGFKVEVQDISYGEEAGIKGATLLIKGEKANGWLKTESGVHRLVRISPYDSNARRHTSFSSIGVYPVIDDNIEIEIQDKDIRIDTFRSSGAGGQHVNTTDSAVRITHAPTGIVVTSSEKSQHQNRANAMKALRARLYDLEMKKREDAAMAEHDAKTDIGWGHQIRSYVLQPYQLVKDLRTGVESTNPSEVLDGTLDEFMEAALAGKVVGEVEDVE
ncbi:peptide chain release factor 2 [Notoacmeibacter sp. MSK16QG-6]|uniref:peptide chain release factor 2 n=1 Tax=Notoacmeibacter sp. MSK16QG-6 TaxID=2957982 RepID=UPI00209D013C|nr:peptide chain release factor 2 [Notoacmeibacter sp. MSK16QG-6]MCP1197842.1 peptide chain release factor 2 [Notoacmeibacter sp. MSK16QG-6]